MNRGRVVGTALLGCSLLLNPSLATGQADRAAEQEGRPAPDAGLPSYQAARVTPPSGAGYVLPDGSIRVVGLDDMTGIIEQLNALFIQTHPNLKFSYRKGNNFSAMASLTFGATAFAPVGAEYTASALIAYDKLLGGQPLAIRVAHGSLNPAAKVSPPAVIVNKGNPIDSLSMGQVTRMFASGAAGGDVTRWNQLGAQGATVGREIHPCGLPESDYYPSEDQAFGAFFVPRALSGFHFTETYEALPNYADVVRRVSTDPQAVGLVALNRVTPDVKVVAIRRNAWSVPSRGAAAEIGQGKYPYDRYLYVYARLVPGQPFDPFVKDYLRLILSREGQQAIAAEAHGYLPLNAREVQEELAKLAEYAP